MTSFEYDGDRLVRQVTVREPEFTPDEVALLLASIRWEAEVGPHGIPYAEAMDPANQFAFDAPGAPEVDWVAKAIKDRQDAYYKRYPDANRNGHIWGKVSRRASRR